MCRKLCAIETPHHDRTLAAIKLAKRIASRAPLSVEATKRQVGQAWDLDRDEAAAAAASELKILTQSADHAAALAAFLTKREPKFKRG